MFNNKKIKDLKQGLTTAKNEISSLQKKIKDRYVNNRSGAGSSKDKGQSGVFSNDGFIDDVKKLENTYKNSWSAAKIIDIPVDDMFILPRQISNLKDNHKEKLEEFYNSLDITGKITSAIKAARLFGTAFIVLITDEDVLTSHINIDSKLTKLKNILVVSRFNTTIRDYDTDITSPNFNNPLIYTFNLTRINPINVHYSRVIRIDGIKPLTIEKWQSGETDINWGVSELSRCLSAIEKEESLACSVNYMVQEASIPVIKIQELKESLAGVPDVDNIDNVIGDINDYKSIYRTLYLDSTMEMTRLEINFAQIPNLFDKYNIRLSAAADIPLVRFMGTSPGGLNSSGDADMQNYAIKVASTQTRLLKPIYHIIDKIVCKTIGIDDTINYTFQPIVDISATDKATIENLNAQTDQIYMVNGVIEESEVRTKVSDTNVYHIDPNMQPVQIDEKLKNDIVNNLKNNKD